MNTSDYLDRLLVKYAGTFDIYQPYVIHGKEYPAYGYFFSHTEKYVLVREANMWSSDSYEHILFIETDEVTGELLKETLVIVKDYMEPVLVRKGQDMPAAGHMYSYLTVAILSDGALTRTMQKAVRKCKFEKGYQFSLRGFSQLHLICATMADGKVYTNFAAHRSAKLYKDTFSDVKMGKAGFRQLCEEKQIEVYKQPLI